MSRGRANRLLFNRQVTVLDCFTYPGWGEHVKKVELAFLNTTASSLSQTTAEEAQKMIKGMERFQLIHDGKLNHPTIQKLRKAKFTYPRCERDVKEAMDCFLRMEDTLAKNIIKVIVRKQRLHIASNENGIESIFFPSTSQEQKWLKYFTYPTWEKHIKIIKDTLANTYNEVELSFGPSREENAAKMFNGMKRLQRVYSRAEQHDDIMLLFQPERKFTYINFARDKEEALIFFLKLRDEEGKELYQVMNLKQDMHEGDRSHRMLLNLDSSSFHYVGWQDHVKEVEMALTSTFKTNLNENREVSAKKLLEGMQRLNSVHVGELRHHGINEFFKTSDSFTYPRWERDWHEVALLYLRFHDTYAKESFLIMKKKQRIQNGDRSDDVLVVLDKLSAVSSLDNDFDTLSSNSLTSHSPRDVTQIVCMEGMIKKNQKAESARIARRKIEGQLHYIIGRKNEGTDSNGEGSKSSDGGNSKASSARESMRRIESQHGKRLKGKLKNNRFGNSLEFDEARELGHHEIEPYDFQDMRTCTSAECSKECIICITYKMNSGDKDGCLCAQISQFDQKSASLLVKLSSEID